MGRQAPEFIRRLPRQLQDDFRKQCDGDWRRVTCEPDGAIVVHNQPVSERPLPPSLPAELKPKPSPPRSRLVTTSPSFRPDRPGDPPGYRPINGGGLFLKPRTKPTASKRSGVPRTAMEHLKRLLDLGCQFQRIPEGHKARVYYLGYQIGMAWVADNTPRHVVAREYRSFREKIKEIDDFFAGNSAT